MCQLDIAVHRSSGRFQTCHLPASPATRQTCSAGRRDAWAPRAAGSPAAARCPAWLSWPPGSRAWALPLLPRLLVPQPRRWLAAGQPGSKSQACCRAAAAAAAGGCLPSVAARIAGVVAKVVGLHAVGCGAEQPLPPLAGLLCTSQAFGGKLRPAASSGGGGGGGGTAGRHQALTSQFATTCSVPTARRKAQRGHQRTPSKPHRLARHTIGPQTR